jgi:hypothetical protein
MGSILVVTIVTNESQTHNLDQTSKDIGHQLEVLKWFTNGS